MPLSVIDANTFFGTYPKRNVNASPEFLVSLLKKNTVERALTLSMKGIFYDYREGNNETIAVCAKNETLVPVATIDLRKYFGNDSEVDDLTRSSFKMLRLFPEYQGWPMDFAPLRVLMREIAGVGLPLMITAQTYGAATKIADLATGLPINLILTSIGYWTMSEAIAIMRANERIFLETHLIDSPDGIEVLCKEVGAERLLFGSNSPLTYFLSPFLSVMNSDISQPDKELIFAGNIRRLVKFE